MGTKHFSQSALNSRAEDILAKYAGGNPQDEDQNPVDPDDYDDAENPVAVDDPEHGGDDGGGDAGNGGQDPNANKNQDEDPVEAKWKSRISVLSGKLRAEFGITSDAEADDSLTPEQRYRLMQADYNMAVAESRRSAQPASAVADAGNPATGADGGQPSTTGGADEVDPDLLALFGDEQIAKSLASKIEKIAEKKAAERIQPVETTVRAKSEQEFASQVWDGPLKGVDHKSQEWDAFNAKEIPFSGGKTFGQLLRQAHDARDIETFNAVRQEFDRFRGGSPAGTQGGAGQGGQRSRSAGFESIATGGRRSAASVVSDNGNAGVQALRAQIDTARKAAERGEGPWAKVRELQAQLSQAHGL